MYLGGKRCQFVICKKDVDDVSTIRLDIDIYCFSGTMYSNTTIEHTIKSLFREINHSLKTFACEIYKLIVENWKIIIATHIFIN